MEEGVTVVSVKHRGGCCCCNRSCGINDSTDLYGTITVVSASISIALVVIFVSLDCGLVRRYIDEGLSIILSSYT